MAGSDSQDGSDGHTFNVVTLAWGVHRMLRSLFAEPDSRCDEPMRLPGSSSENDPRNRRGCLGGYAAGEGSRYANGQPTPTGEFTWPQQQRVLELS